MITMAPTGKLVHGDVLDVNRRALERALRDYDSQVYLHWNPDKCKGWGAWELRRKPNLKTALYVGSYQGNAFYEIDYLENNFDNHLKDWAFLNYSILGWMKSQDAWKHKSFSKAVEDQETAHAEQLMAKAEAEKRYQAKQIKSQIRGFRELILSGTNPADLARYWDSN